MDQVLHLLNYQQQAAQQAAAAASASARGGRDIPTPTTPLAPPMHYGQPPGIQPYGSLTTDHSLREGNV